MGEDKDYKRLDIVHDLKDYKRLEKDYERL